MTALMCVFLFSQHTIFDIYLFSCRSEDYIHRIGRTGRRQTGTAYTFFTSGNARQARELIGVLEEAGQKPEPALLDMARINSNGKGGSRSRYNVRPQNNYGMHKPVNKNHPNSISLIKLLNVSVENDLTGKVNFYSSHIAAICSQ